jgi:hypothetical protein
MEHSQESNLMRNIQEVCKQYDGKLEVGFVRGKMGSGLQRRNVLVMLVGPRLTLELVQELRKDILEALDAKEKQLRGDKLPPDVAVVNY